MMNNKTKRNVKLMFYTINFETNELEEASGDKKFRMISLTCQPWNRQDIIKIMANPADLITTPKEEKYNEYNTK